MALVNFSIPNIPSFKSTTPSPKPILFVPDVEKLIKFAQGDLGIADSIRTSMIVTNIAKCTDPFQLESFLKAAGGKLKNPIESYFQDGRLTFDPSDLSIDPKPGDLGGLKSLEKALFQSIFDTQKPYVEIIKLVTENLVKIEDIVARVLAAGGSSMKPADNPKALGYKGNSEVAQSMFKLQSLAKPSTSNQNQNQNQDQNVESNTPEEKTAEVLPPGFSYATQSILYSTGEFDPTVDYTYIYKDFKDDSIVLPDGTASATANQDDEKPKVVVFGIFDSTWKPLQSSFIDTPIQTANSNGTVQKNVNWLKRSNKWFNKFDQYVEGTDFSYQTDADGNIIYYGSNEGPSVTLEGETKYVKEGFPKLSVKNGLISSYRNYYIDETRIKLSKREDLSVQERQNIISEIGKTIDKTDSTGIPNLQNVIEGNLKNSFCSITNENNTPGLPADFITNAKFPFKPKKITYNSKEVWIDPEAQYDLKIIKCDSSIDIKYLDIEGDSSKTVSTQILRFVKKSLVIRLSNDENFDYILTGTTDTIPLQDNTNEFVLDNHSDSSAYSIEIRQSKIPNEYSDGISWDEIIGNTTTGNRFTLTTSNGTSRLSISFLDSQVQNPTFNDSYILPNGKKFFVDDSGVLLYTEIYNGSLSDYLPSNLEKNTVIINMSDFSLTETRGIIPPNLIRVKDTNYKFGKLISNTQITNEQLVTTNPYSKNGLYGTPNIKNQNIEQIYRYMITEDDTETYYIVEGILSSDNKQKLNAPNGGSSTNASGNSPDSGDYSLPDVVGAFPIFIEMLVDIFSKLIPLINQFINTIKNPTQIVFNIIVAKMGDAFGTEAPKFGFFSSDFLNDLRKLRKIEDDDVTERAKKMREFVNNSKLFNYVNIDENANPRFILDGIATVKLFGDAPGLSSLPGIKFGIESNLTSLASSDPKEPFKLVFQGPTVNTLKSIPELSGLVANLENLKSSALSNVNLEPKLEIPSEIQQPNGQFEDVSIQYSTGVFREDVDYKYIYITEESKKLVDEAKKYEEEGDLNKAVSLLEDAAKLDPNNSFIFDKLEQLKKLSELMRTNPIFDFLLNIVTLPLKVIFNVVEYIMNFFKSLTNPFELPGAIAEFVSFKWLKDLFDPTSKKSMFALAGILFDVPTFTKEWLPSLISGSKNEFDFNKIIKLPWVMRLPKFSLEQFRFLTFGYYGKPTPNLIPLQMLNAILSLIEKIINAFIDFVWSLLGLGAIIDPPYVRLTRDFNLAENMSPKDILDLLSGNYKDPNSEENSNKEYNFAYEIKAPDGRDIRDLNYEELQKWVDENKNLQFVYNF
jgi:hypothetical protein